MCLCVEVFIGNFYNIVIISNFAIIHFKINRFGIKSREILKTLNFADNVDVEIRIVGSNPELKLNWKQLLLFFFYQILHKKEENIEENNIF